MNEEKINAGKTDPGMPEAESDPALKARLGLYRGNAGDFKEGYDPEKFKKCPECGCTDLEKDETRCYVCGYRFDRDESKTVGVRYLKFLTVVFWITLLTMPLSYLSTILTVTSSNGMLHFTGWFYLGLCVDVPRYVMTVRTVRNPDESAGYRAIIATVVLMWISGFFSGLSYGFLPAVASTALFSVFYVPTLIYLRKRKSLWGAD